MEISPRGGMSNLHSYSDMSPAVIDLENGQRRSQCAIGI